MRLLRVRGVPLRGAALSVAAPQIEPRFNLPGSPNETGPQEYSYFASSDDHDDADVDVDPTAGWQGVQGGGLRLTARASASTLLLGVGLRRVACLGFRRG